MKVPIKALLCAAALLLSAICSGQAEDLQLEPQFDPFLQASYPPTFAAPEASLVNYTGAADAGSCTTNDAPSRPTTQRQVGRDFLVCKDRCAGLVGGSEVVFLRPFSSGFGLESLDILGLGLGFTPAQGAQFGFEPTARNWIGYQSADGLGGRFRFWQFDRGASNFAGLADLIANGDDGIALTNLGLEFRTLDLEMTQTVDFRRWNFLVSGGLRYGEAAIDRTDIEVDTGVLDLGTTTEAGFDGFGLTTALQASRDLNPSGSWRLTMSGRWSALYGNNKYSGTSFDALTGVVDPTFSFVKNDAVVNVFELNVGPQYRRRLQNGSFLTIGTGFEAQTWTNTDGVFGGIFGLGGLGLLGNGDIGFAGFSTSISLTR